MSTPRPAVAVALVAVLTALACGHGETSGSGPAGGMPSTKVKVLTLAPGALEHAAGGVGAVEALQSADLAAETSGTVVSVRFEDGQAVGKGDLLVKLRDDAPRAQLKDAEARLALATAKLERVQALFERQNTSRQELDQATAERDLAEAAVALARDAVRKTEVRAPFDGVVGRREVSPGATVSPSTRVTRIEDLSTVTVDVDLPERLLPELAVGQPVRVSVDAFPDHAFEGELRFVSPRIDASTRMVSTRVHVDNADGVLRPGLTARVEIVTDTLDDALLVPTQAVVPSANGPSVYVAGAEQKAELRPVVTGVRRESAIEVLDGLQPGDRVIVEGLLRLQPGAAIEIVADGGGEG